MMLLHFFLKTEKYNDEGEFAYTPTEHGPVAVAAKHGTCASTTLPYTSFTYKIPSCTPASQGLPKTKGGKKRKEKTTRAGGSSCDKRAKAKHEGQSPQSYIAPGTHGSREMLSLGRH